MALIPVTYPATLASAPDVAALYRALGVREVSVKGWRTCGEGAVEALVAAVVPENDNTIEFEDGTFDDDAWAGLAELVDSAPSYLDLTTAAGNLRVWPTHAWVLGPAGLERAQAAVSDARGMPVELHAGTNTFPGGLRVTVDPAAGWPLNVEAEDGIDAFCIFRALAPVTLPRGYVMRPSAEVLAALVPFLHALRCTVDASIVVEPARAVALAAHFEGASLEWQADRTIVRADGSITSYIPSSQPVEEEKKKWLARIAKALQRVK